jgi:DNA modification methylase
MSDARKRRRRATATSSFGVSARVGHDASAFYSRRLYEGLPEESREPYYENPLPEACQNQIFCKSAEQMEELPDACVHLMVTSPPYNVGKDYDEDLSLDEYRAFLKSVMKEVYRVLVPGGRACINVANLGRKPYLPLHAFVIQDMLELGFLMRGEIIWDKGAAGGSSTAWGSWCSPQNPTLRDVHEYILVFSKGLLRRPKPPHREATISREAFLAYTKSVWSFPPESASRVGHPAPFPVELPYRLIQFYTFSGEVVLDPFMGSGTTAVAALKSERLFVGYETNPAYIGVSQSRLQSLRTEKPLLF